MIELRPSLGLAPYFGFMYATLAEDRWRSARTHQCGQAHGAVLRPEAAVLDRSRPAVGALCVLQGFAVCHNQTRRLWQAASTLGSVVPYRYDVADVTRQVPVAILRRSFDHQSIGPAGPLQCFLGTEQPAQLGVQCQRPVQADYKCVRLLTPAVLGWPMADRGISHGQNGPAHRRSRHAACI
jgi:hypothetical protein